MHLHTENIKTCMYMHTNNPGLIVFSDINDDSRWWTSALLSSCYRNLPLGRTVERLEISYLSPHHPQIHPYFRRPNMYVPNKKRIRIASYTSNLTEDLVKSIWQTEEVIFRAWLLSPGAVWTADMAVCNCSSILSRQRPASPWDALAGYSNLLDKFQSN